MACLAAVGYAWGPRGPVCVQLWIRALIVACRCSSWHVFGSATSMQITCWAWEAFSVLACTAWNLCWWVTTSAACPDAQQALQPSRAHKQACMPLIKENLKLSSCCGSKAATRMTDLHPCLPANMQVCEVMLFYCPLTLYKRCTDKAACT